MATQVLAAQTIGASRIGHQAAERNLSLLAQQQRTKRGPTPEVFFVKRIDNTRLVKADDPVRLREMRTFTTAIVTLFLLLMFYGWQHFSAIECGYRLETARQQMQGLEEQNRDLRLTEAQLADPSRIDTMAKNLGLSAPQPGQVVHPSANPDLAGGAVMAAAHPSVPAMH